MGRRRRTPRATALSTRSFDKTRTRPLEWVSVPGTIEDLWPMSPEIVTAAATETGGTPASQQHSRVVFPARTDGGIITLTRLVGELHLYILTGSTLNMYMAGFQLVPFREDTTIEPRFLMDGDDVESKEWLWRMSYPPFYKGNLGAGDYELVTNFPDPHFDIKTQRRYDTGLYALVFSLAWNTGAPVAQYALSGRLLARTGTGLQ